MVLHHFGQLRVSSCNIRTFKKLNWSNIGVKDSLRILRDLKCPKGSLGVIRGSIEVLTDPKGSFTDFRGCFRDSKGSLINLKERSPAAQNFQIQTTLDYVITRYNQNFKNLLDKNALNSVRKFL